MTDGDPEPSAGAQLATLWSVVLAAGSTDSVVARPALQQLCSTYWYPLYSFARRQGFGPADAEDITQGFFAHLLEHDGLRGLDRARGRFRSFLLASLRNFINNLREHQAAKKRGGGREIVSLDAAAAEEKFGIEPRDPAETPEKLFDRQWAHALLDRALGRLRGEFAAAGKAGHFDALQETLAGERVTGGYAALGGRLGMSEGAVKVAVHRFRLRYREVIREEIAATIGSPGDIEDELRELFAALGP